MLEAIRSRVQGHIAKVVLGLIIVVFALWGVESYITGGGKEKSVASVNGVEITQKEFLDALKRQRELLEGRGSQVDIDNKEFRENVLDQLVDTAVLTQTSESAGYLASDELVHSILHSISGFQENGQFSDRLFNEWLRDRNMSQPLILKLLREEVLLRHLQAGISEGAVAPASSGKVLLDLLAQQREISELIFDGKKFADGIRIDDKAVQADYNANQQQFAVPAQVKVQYLVLSAETLMGHVKVDEAALLKHYEGTKARFQEPELRRASHILIRADAKMSAADKQAAKAKAEKLLAEARQTPAKFADLARQNSQDPGSAVNGGDLGEFPREAMVKPFADAVFGMKTGEIVGPVETEFGYHIIRLDGVKPGKLASFEEVRPQVEVDLRQQEAQRQFAEAAERFGNLVYEQSDSLEPAAKELGLEIKQSGWVGQGRGDPGFLAHPQLLERLFSDEALKNKQNTEAVEVAPGMLVSARVMEHKPAGVRPLTEVGDLIRAKLTQQTARARAIAAGQAALKAAQAGQSLAGLGAPVSLSRMQPTLPIPREAMQAIFKVKADKLPQYVGVETPDGYRLYKVSKVTPGQPPEEMKGRILKDVSGLMAREEMRAYRDYAKTQAKLKIDKEAAVSKQE